MDIIAYTLANICYLRNRIQMHLLLYNLLIIIQDVRLLLALILAVTLRHPKACYVQFDIYFDQGSRDIKNASCPQTTRMYRSLCVKEELQKLHFNMCPNNSKIRGFFTCKDVLQKLHINLCANSSNVCAFCVCQR